MHVALMAGMKDYSLPRILKPFLSLPYIQKVSCVRYTPLQMEKVVSYAPPSWIASIKIFRELYRVGKIFMLCMFGKVDMIIGIHFYMHCVYAGMMGWLFRKPVIFLIIEDPQKYKGNFLFSFFIRRASFVFVRGASSQAYLVHQLGVAEERVAVLADFLNFSEDVDHDATTKIYDFVYVGRFESVKRLDIFLNVLKELKEQHIPCQTIMAGEGSLFSEMRQKCQSLGLEDCVEMPGFVTYPEKILKQSRIFMMTSQTEGLPMAMIEAFRKGLPCIMPDLGDISDLAIHEKNAVLVKPLDQDAFVQAAERLLTEQDLYEQLQAGCAYTFDPQKYALPAIQSVWTQAIQKIKPGFFI